MVVLRGWGSRRVGGRYYFCNSIVLALRQKMFRAFFCNYKTQSLTLQPTIFYFMSSSIIPFKDAGMYFCQVKPIVNSKVFKTVTKDVVI